MSWVYILHFDRPHFHAAHYTGCCVNYPDRLSRHAAGDGANLTKVLIGLGIGWQLGGLYQVTRQEDMRRVERRVKQQHNAARYCQICSPEGAARLHGATCYDIGLVAEEVRYPHNHNAQDEESTNGI